MHSPFLGISLAALSMLFFSITYAFYKACGPYLPNTHTIFFQSLLSWILILPFALKGGIRHLISPQLGKIIARSLCGLLGLYFITRALLTVGLAEVVVLNNTAPLFVPLILLLWHKTKITSKIAVGLLVGFIGVYIIFRPGFHDIHIDLIFAFLSGICTALLVVITRLIAHEPFLRIMFYYFLMFWVALLPFVWIGWRPIPPVAWLYIIGAAIAMIAAQVSFTLALRHAPSQEVAPFIYTSVIFAGLIDWWIWQQTPSLISVIGMLVVCVGGIITMNFNKKRTI